MLQSTKALSILSAAALAIGTAIPAFAAPPEPDAGDQTGTGKTTLKLIVDGTEYGGTEDADNPNSTGQEGQAGYDADAPGANLAFTAPTELDFVVKASGDMLAPSPSATAICNKSAYGIHVSSLDVDSPSGWNLVTDANFAASASANTISMNIGPATDDAEKISISSYLDKANLTNGLTKWGMSASGTGQDKDRLYLSFDGKAKNLNAGFGSLATFATIHWYLTSGGEGTRYIDPANRIAINKVSATNGSFKISTSATGNDDRDYAADGDMMYIVAEPSQHYEVDEMHVKKASDNSDVIVTKNSQDPNTGSFVMPGEEISVSVTFKEYLPLNQYSLSELSTISASLASQGENSPYWSEFQGYAGTKMDIPLNSSNSTISAASEKNRIMTVRLIGINEDVDEYGNPIGLTFMSTHALPMGYWINKENTCAGGWAATILRDALNQTGSADANTELYDLFSTELTNVVKPAKKFTRTVPNQSVTPADFTIDKFWVPSNSELDRTPMYAWGDYYMTVGEEGAAYKAYPMKESSSLANMTTTRAGTAPVAMPHTGYVYAERPWVLRTANPTVSDPSSTSGFKFTCINSGGNTNACSAGGNYFPIVVAFCI